MSQGCTLALNAGCTCDLHDSQNIRWPRTTQSMALLPRDLVHAQLQLHFHSANPGNGHFLNIIFYIHSMWLIVGTKPLVSEWIHAFNKSLPEGCKIVYLSVFSKSYDFINIYHFRARLHSGHIYDKIIGIKCSKGHSRMKYDFGADLGNLGFMSLGRTHS